MTRSPWALNLKMQWVSRSVHQTLSSLVDEDAVGIFDDVFAPGGEEVAVAVEDDEGMLAARVDEDAVLGVAGDRGYPAELPPCGQFGPVFDYFVLIGAGSERHGNLLCLVETRCGGGGEYGFFSDKHNRSIREVTRRGAKNIRGVS